VDATRWDERYASADAVWSGKVNPTLITHVTGVAPGRALEAAAGEGADAIWLAAAGWQVTALDFSQVALGRASAAAQRAGVQDRVRTVCADLLTWVPDTSYDLVVAHFLQLEPDSRAFAYATLRDAVAPGGRLLLVGHDPADIASGLRRPRGEGRLVSATDLATELLGDGWIVEVARAEPRTVVVDGADATAYDSVLLALRSA
jgi:SAM-dependent methyltransferase